MDEIKIGDKVYLPTIDMNYDGIKPAILVQAYEVIDISQKGELKVKSSCECGWQDDDETYFPTFQDAVIEAKNRLFKEVEIRFYDIKGELRGEQND